MTLDVAAVKADFPLLQRKIAEYSYPNLFIRQAGGGIEVCSGVPA